jgi:hypothetical protein
MPEISIMSILSFPLPETVVSLRGSTEGTRETDMKLQPEEKSRQKTKIEI